MIINQSINLGATLSKDGTCRADIRILVATATAVSKLVFYAQSPLRLYQSDTATAVSKLVFYAQSPLRLYQSDTATAVSKMVFYAQSPLRLYQSDTATAVRKMAFYAQSPLRLYQSDTATAAMARLNRLWKSNISFQTRFQLFGSLVISILLYGCETWLAPSCSTGVRYGGLHPALRV